MLELEADNPNGISVTVIYDGMDNQAIYVDGKLEKERAWKEDLMGVIMSNGGVVREYREGEFDSRTLDFNNGFPTDLDDVYMVDDLPYEFKLDGEKTIDKLNYEFSYIIDRYVDKQGIELVCSSKNEMIANAMADQLKSNHDFPVSVRVEQT